MSELVIRRAQSDDSAQILIFIQALAEYEKLAHEVIATEDMLRQTLFGDQPQAFVLIAEWHGQAAGFALFFNNYSTFLGRAGIYLEDLFVLPEHRGKGIGKALLVELARLTRQNDGGRLEWSVLDWNEPSIKFYEKLGAQGMREWVPFRLTGDALKRLASVC